MSLSSSVVPRGVRDGQELGRLADLLLQASPTVYSASLAQQRLWFLHQLQGRSSAYTVHLGMWLRGSLDLAALHSAIREMVNRHDSLRTAFRLERETLQQVVEPACSIRIPITDLTSVADPTAEAYQLARREVEKPFDLSKAPLFRVCLYRATPQDHVLLCTMHHIVTDAWSMRLFAKELEMLYSAFSRGQASSLSPLPIRYGDFAEWQLEWFHTDRVQQQLAFWKDKLEGAPALLELPTDAPRPLEQTFEGAVQYTPISSDIIEGIEKVAARCQATPFMVQLAAFKVLLYRYAKQHDVVVGIPVAGRNQVETEELIGFFVNTLVLRDDLSGNPRLTDLVAQVRETILSAFSNADVPFEKIVETLQPERNLGYNPLFQVMFATLKSAVRSHKFGDLTAYPYVVSAESSIFDLSMTLIQDVDRQWFASIEYNTNLFGQERIGRMLNDYISVLQGVVSHPEGHILTLPLPSMPGPVDILKVPCADKQKEDKQEKDNEQRIPSPSVSRKTYVRRFKPLDREEEVLVEVWKEVLGLPEVGIRDSFFDVGGHSLLAVRLIARIQEITGRRIPVAAIFRAPTIEAFAPLLRENITPEPDPVLVRLKDGDGVIPFFAIAAPGADTFGLSLLALHMGSDQSVYKVQASAPILWGRPFTKDELRTLAREYIAAMRSVQPHGPYCVGGMCEGVLIAQEVILELESMHEEVGVFAIFDTWVLENSQIRALWAVEYYRQRFQIFRSLPKQERVATTKRFVQRLFGRNRNGNGSGSGWNRIYWPGEEFREPQFQAPVLLFKRPRQPYFYVRDPQMGWGVRSAGGVELCELNCAHNEFLRRPQVGTVGKVLGGRLQSIRGGEVRRTPVSTPHSRPHGIRVKSLEAHSREAH
jgi:thioesterase domain-containing protein